MNRSVVNFSYARSEDFELRRVLRELKKNGRPDRTHIVVLNPQSLAACFEMTRLYGVPCTFSPGVPLFYSKAARTVTNWMLWMTRGCEGKYLVRMMYEGIPAPQDEMYEDVRGGRLQMASLLRAARIGNGRARLLDAVDLHIDALRRQAEEDEAAQHTLRQAMANRSWLMNLLAITPEPDEAGTLPKQVFVAAALKLVRTLCRDAFPGEEIALRRLEEVLPDETPDETDVPVEAGQLRDTLARRIEHSTLPTILQTPGKELVVTTDPLREHLHVSTLAETGACHRPSLHILCGDVRTDIPEEIPGLLDSLLRTHQGDVTVSWSTSAADIDGHRCTPERMLLELYRKLHKDDTLSMRDLEKTAGKAETLLPSGVPLSDAERFLQQSCIQDAETLRRNLHEWSPLLREGARATGARASAIFTAWDGHCGENTNAESNSEITSMQLKRFLDCPYAFFLHDILHIHPPPPLSALPEDASRIATNSLQHADNAAADSGADDTDTAFIGNGSRLAHEVRQHVTAMLRTGCFPHTDRARHCQHCSYQIVCMDTATVNQEARAMLANPDEHTLDTWRTLREIAGRHQAASAVDDVPAKRTDTARMRETTAPRQQHATGTNDAVRGTSEEEDYGSMWQCAEVRAVFSVLKALSDPEHSLPVVSFLRGPLCGADDLALLGYHRAGGRFVFNARAVPGTDKRVADGMQFLKDNVRLLRSQPPGTVVATILDRLALHALAVANTPEGHGADAVHMLADISARFSRNSATFADIVEQLETQLKKK